MNCEQAKTLFLAYQDDELSPDDKDAFEAHLKQCPACTEELEAYVQTLNEVSGMFPMQAPKDFTLRVKQTIDKRSRGRFFGEERPLGVSFAVVSFVLILLFLMAYFYLFSAKEITVLAPATDPVPDTDTAARTPQ